VIRGLTLAEVVIKLQADATKTALPKGSKTSSTTASDRAWRSTF